MIKTLAELLDRLKAKELEAIARFGDLGHQGMIGDMYEGLTRELLTKSLFEGQGLRVVTGKVRMPDGSYSKQMDAMIVMGEAQLLPHTDQFIYPPERVIAAVEVKKTLYATALDDAYQNLYSLRDDDYLDRIPASTLQLVYKRIAHAELPADGDLTQLPPEREMLAHALLWEVAMPVRIVLGYGGYVSELTLRDGLVDYLDRVLKSGKAQGYGPPGFPSLIICGTNSLVKLNAMPFSANTSNDDEWLFYASSRSNPIRLLLEVIWTRLHSKNLVSAAVFGEDLEIEQLNPLFESPWVYRRLGYLSAPAAVVAIWSS